MQQSYGRILQETDDAHLRQIVAQNADGIIVVNGEGLVRFCNPAAAAILGRRQDDLIGQNFGYPILRTERAEIDLIRPDGASQIAEMRVVDTEWEGGSAQLISLRDITAHRRAEQALRDAEAFNWAILNALTVHVAVLDASGVIIAVNDAWREFAQANGDPDLRATGVGVNYFTICSHAAGACAEEAPMVVEGLRAVLNGRLPFFELEYPCHSPMEERWFTMRAVPLRGDRPGLVIAHTNVTEQRRMARSAAEAEALRERLRARERELRDIDRISRHEPPPQRRQVAAPLRQRNPEAFHSATRRYRGLLDQALDHRARQEALPASLLRQIGELLGAYEAAPRDVVEVHLAAIREAGADAPHAKQQAYLEEGRLLMLELMGHLTAYYRAFVLKGEGISDDVASG